MNDVKEKAKAFLGKTKERLKKVSRKVWIAIAAVLVVLIVATADNRPFGGGTQKTDSPFEQD